MTKARDIADFKFENIVDTGTEGTKVATGTTAQRGSTTGQWRFNTTTGYFEGRNNTGSFSTLEPTPTVTSVDVTEVESDAGGNQTFVISGTNFSSGGVVAFIGTSAQFNASTTTYNNANQITAVAPKASFLNAQEPYKIKFTSTSGVAGTSATGLINVDNAPSWSTSAGTLATISDQDTGTHATLSASDPDGDTVSYSETGGTNITGAGLSLNSSTGVISGNPTDVANSTTVSFTGRATAGSKTTDRAFNIIIDPYRDVYFGILGAGGGGAGRQSSSYQGSSDWHGAGGAGSFVEAVYTIKLGTTIYTYVGHYGQSGQGGAGGAINAYGGNGKSGGTEDTSGEGGDFSGIFTANSVTQANALIIAGGGGGGAGRPHGAGGGGSQNGGGQIESASTGEGNDGTRGHHSVTHSHGSDRGGQGGQQNNGGAAGTASGSSSNNAQAGSALQGGNGSSAPSWGNGGGGGGGFFGGGGGQDDGTSWGGAGGGAGSSFARGGITNYSTSAFNSVTATGITYVSHTFRTASFGYDGGTTQDSQSANRMKTTYDFSSFGTGYGTNGKGGRENSSYSGAGTDGGHGLVFYRIGNSGSYTKLTSTNTSGNLTALTIS